MTTMLRHFSKIGGMYPRILHPRLSKISSPSRSFKGLIQVSSIVQEGLSQKKPIVSLESTIITHGLPYPENLRMAKEVENIIHENGCIPATIAVINGIIHVGLASSDLENLSQLKGAMKVSRRDLPFVLSQGLTGGTTVSGTMIAANKVGIKVFVTGGIGGVHRNGEQSMDISADLIELSRTPMAVVSAGVKSILDIGRTLEYLETHGVCVATYGSSQDFPAFFVPSSGHSAPCSVATPLEAAKMIAIRDELQLSSGILFAVPIPSHLAAEGSLIEQAINKALEEAEQKQITGKDITPFVLQRVNELTGGASLKANLALVKNNAIVGSKIAKELAALQQVSPFHLSQHHVQKSSQPMAMT